MIRLSGATVAANEWFVIRGAFDDIFSLRVFICALVAYDA